MDSTLLVGNRSRVGIAMIHARSEKLTWLPKLGRLGLAGVLGDEMNGTRRFEEAFPDLEGLDRAARQR